MNANRHLIDPECAVIGAIMLTGRSATFHEVADILSDVDFVDGRHSLLWSAIAELAGRGSPIDAVTVAEWIASNGIQGLVGSETYILELANNTPSAANIRAYAEIVAERARKRRVRKIGDSLASAGDDLSAAELAARYMAELMEIAGRRTQTMVTWREALSRAWSSVQAAYETGGVIAGAVLTPWRALNALLISMRPADLIVLAARPSMGKTAVALNIAIGASLAFMNDKDAPRKRVMIFSLEMAAEQLAIRALAMAASTPIGWLRSPGESDEYWTRISGAVTACRDLPIIIDEEAILTADQIFARAARENERGKLGLLVIDHTHLISLGEGEVRHEGARMTKTLKALAKRLGCPVLALAQLSRSVESRADKRPVMSDLREFGSLEQDADAILFCYRDEYYNRDTPNPGNLEIGIGKNRDGALGVAHLHFEGSTNAITDHPEGWAPYTPQQTESKPRRGFNRSQS